MSSWIFIVFLTSGVGSVLLSLRYRESGEIGRSLPASVLICTGGVICLYSIVTDQSAPFDAVLVLALIVFLFLVLTQPIAAHMIGRAACIGQVDIW
ncbi:MAG TPA: monovalent cation/H(+) antiporter subunit G [Thermomicrobiales bacterium]|nr:monovalent cation/H(+) antiporter subunit G [Thermomicrobiales bacterium]